MSNKTQTLLLSRADIEAAFFDKRAAIDILESAMVKRAEGNVILPDKSSQIYDKAVQNRINCMPASIVSDGVAGVKWVAVFPNNPSLGLENVTGTIVLSELKYGTTLSVMDGTYITNLRTATMGAVAAKYLARADSHTIGFIGAGKEAMNHLDMIKLVRPGIRVCRVSSRSDATVSKFIETESVKHPDIEFIACGNDFERAVIDADIIVTATSTQRDLLKAAWIKKGATYIHVGGWEDEFAVAKMAGKIVCDEWECIKHRTQTISLMYKAGELNDTDIYADLGEIILGQKSGRESEDEFIYFCSVGLAFVDVAFADYAYNRCKDMGLGTKYTF